jgi:hypothetical protein
VAQLFSLGIKIGLRLELVGWSGERFEQLDLDEQAIGS